MVKEITGYQFWREILGSPRYILAPMVEQSELAWRLLSRRYGSELCYTPMLHASVFIKDARYRKDNLASCKGDRPLIVQFCANDVESFVEAAKLAEDHCDAIDLNLGCPQTIAQRGHYGAFLEDEWDLLKAMVNVASLQLKIPVTCKIRVFNSVEHTIEYAKMLESAGCKLLTVHGRTKEQKGAMTGLASWKHIKAVKENVKIPVFANGNIQYLKDVTECMRQTGVDGVMIAEGSLHNPALFANINPPVWQASMEYLQMVMQYPCSMSSVRGHLFKICHHCLVIPNNHDIREKFASAKNLEEVISAVEELKSRYENKDFSTVDSIRSFNLPFPPWICQPYVRPALKISDINNVLLEKNHLNRDVINLSFEEISISKKKMKRSKKPKKSVKAVYELCTCCYNPKGTKCVFNLCKTCCKNKSSLEFLDCVGHRFLFLTKRKLTTSPSPQN